jgi:hypothetical protein
LHELSKIAFADSAASTVRATRIGAIGISRTGTPGSDYSGDIFLAFSTAAVDGRADGIESLDYVRSDMLDPLVTAMVEATEEAISDAPRGHARQKRSPFGRYVRRTMPHTSKPSGSPAYHHDLRLVSLVLSDCARPDRHHRRLALRYSPRQAPALIRTSRRTVPERLANAHSALQFCFL